MSPKSTSGLKPNQRVTLLIDAAAAKAGSAYRLAKLIGYTDNEVTMWKHGARPCPAKAQALMAEVAGLDAVDVFLHASIEAEPNVQRRERLYTVLGKAFALTSAAASSSTYAKPALAFSEAAGELIRCILC